MDGIAMGLLAGLGILALGCWLSQFVSDDEPADEPVNVDIDW